MRLLDELSTELAQRAADGLLRRRRVLQSPQSAHVVVDGRELLSFCSNDYLGLASHPDLITAMQQALSLAGAGSGASHLVTGHHQLHEQLEHSLAEFTALPAALLFTTGYMANLGIVTALLGRDDVLFADRLNHASLNDAAVLSRARLQRFAHNDMAALQQLLAASTARRKLVAVDAVFSMDGDLAPLAELLDLCERYDAYLLVDDAHGFGVLGEHGRGTLQHLGMRSPRILYMATLGKAAGVSGAFVAGEQVLVDYLTQQARSYIYTTAAPPANAAGVMAAIQLMLADDGQRKHLHALIDSLRSQLQLQRWALGVSMTAIQPLMIGNNHEAVALSEYLLTQGILVPAIRPPTVPKGTARLRISLSAAHCQADISRLVEALEQAQSLVPEQIH